MPINLGTLFQKKIKLKDLVLITRELRVLTQAGVPIVKSLYTLEEQLEGAHLKKMAREIAQDVEKGETLAEAMGKQGCFPVYYVNMIKAAEAGGKMDLILKRLATILERNERIKRKVRSALMYPIFVTVVAIGIITMVLCFVIPSFVELFEELGGELPLMTRVLIGVSDLLRHYGILIFGFFGLLFPLHQGAKQLAGYRFFLDRWKLNLPVFGVLIRKLATVRFAGTLGTLIQSGIPILNAIEMTKDTIANSVIEQAMDLVSQSVREGGSLWLPLKESRCFPPIVVKMVSVGEESGALDEMLERISLDYEEEIDTMLAGLVSLLEPMLTVFISLMVGFIVVAMFFPILSLVKLLGE